ncbi:MAG: UDP-N-acetylglucosamine--N-acetylmuramyl-(pentapeptide) pyrophosphoryl-undecaprenol N-acetylglucosamine transferase [Clostridiaceae bacterium]|nr:UDP-N-acetylglucosamine--N-acetylmuramyl-(pentapeptide) pyrophosphoryl-undecaprenol N-acetylglucosamine transferase [Clostridiaceae bacterium]
MKRYGKRKKVADTIIVVAGGTSGHIYPALAIASELKRLHPLTRLVFCGVEKGLEQKLVQAEGFEFRPIAAQNMPSKHDCRYVSWVTQNIRGIFLSDAILEEERPRLVIGTGGFVSAPLLAAAKWRGVPYIIHEQNSVPGRANRMFARKAETVFLSYDASRQYFPDKSSLIMSGNPVRKIFYEIDRQSAREALNIEDDLFLVLLMGGSLGARTLNNAVAHIDDEGKWSALLEKHPTARLSISTGVQSDKSLADELAKIPGVVKAEHFFHDAPYWIAACDFFVGRAGAMTCAEIAAQAKPSMLIPYPFAADDHQTENARAMQEAGASIICADSDFDSQTLLDTISQMIQQPEVLAEMGESAGRWATPQAARVIAESVPKVVK